MYASLSIMVIVSGMMFYWRLDVQGAGILGVATCDALVRIESGGGINITNCKLNGGGVGSHYADIGLDLAITTGTSTSILMLENVSIENVNDIGIKVTTTGTGNWDQLVFNGLQFGLYNISAGGRAVQINAASSGQIDGLIISNCIIWVTGSPANEAISLTNVNYGKIFGNVVYGFTSLLTQSGCSYIVTSDALESVAWTDYSSTSTITGWSSFTNKYIYYKKVGDLVFVEFNIRGTSDNTLTQFTLPYNTNANPNGVFFQIRAMDNGSYLTTGPFGALSASGNTVTLYSTPAGGSWTNSGNKYVMGQFFYVAA